MGAPSDYFFFAYYGGLAPLSVFLHTIWGPLRSFFLHITIYGGPSGKFLCILYGAPQLTFFVYYVGAPQISLFAYYIWGPPPPSSDQFFCKIYRGPSDQFFTYYMGAPRSFFWLLYRANLRLVSDLTIWGPLRSVSVHTI